MRDTSNRWRMPVLLGAALAGAAYIYASRIEPGWVRVREMRVRLPRLDRAFHGYRLAHISDIHMGGAMTPARLHDTVTLINTLQPDLVAITGDFVQDDPRAAGPHLAEALGALRAPDGVVAVLGNHDYRCDAAAVRRMLAQAAVRELPNTVHTLRRGAACLHIAGVDDIATGRDNLDAVLDALPPDGAAVLLAHEPDFADISAPTGRFDLQLSGHTHAGQIRLPFIGAPVLPSFGRFYDAGRYEINGMTQYTTSGLGTIWPHVRFNARPEVAVLLLEAGDDQTSGSP